MAKVEEVVEVVEETPIITNRTIAKIALVLSIISVTFIIFVMGAIFGAAVQSHSDRYDYYGGGYPYPVYDLPMSTPPYYGVDSEPGVMEPGTPMPVEGENGIGDGTTGDIGNDQQHNYVENNGNGFGKTGTNN